MQKIGTIGFFMIATATLAGCAVSTAPTDDEKEVSSQSEPLIAPGMLSDDYSPLVAGSGETVAAFNPMLGQSPENVTFIGQDAFVTSLLSGEILRVSEDGTVTSIHVPVPPGTFVAGIQPYGSNSLVFSTALFGPYGPVGSYVYKLNIDTLDLQELAYMPGAALNGLAIEDLGGVESWLSVDAMAPSGVIWKGSLEGGPAAVWYEGPAVQPNASYVVTPCNPPMPVGGNGARAYTELGMRSLVVSNTTGSSVTKIPLLQDGTPGQEALWYDTSAAPWYPDDIWPDHCGIPGFRRGAFIATHGQHRILYGNPYTGRQTELTTGLDCDGPTAVVVHGQWLYATCGGDPLICRPDQNGNPDPSLSNLGTPALKRWKLKWTYLLPCRP